MIYQGRPGGVLWIDPTARGAHRHRPRDEVPERYLPAPRGRRRAVRRWPRPAGYVAEHRAATSPTRRDDHHHDDGTDQRDRGHDHHPGRPDAPRRPPQHRARASSCSARSSPSAPTCWPASAEDATIPANIGPFLGDRARPAARRPPRHPPPRARRRRHAPADRRRCSTASATSSSSASTRPRRTRRASPACSRRGSPSASPAFIAHPPGRPPGARPRALPLDVRAGSASACSCSRSCRASGKTINGARIWVSIGPINFQPGEFAKILLAIFFASYLVEKRELLAVSSRRVGPLPLPDLKHLGPVLLAWGVSLVVMVVREGPRLVAAVLRPVRRDAVGGHRAGHLPRGRAGCCSAGGAVFAHSRSPTSQDRVDIWLDPWAGPEGRRLPDRPGAVRVLGRRRHRHRPRPRRAHPHPATRRPTSSSRPSARSSACSGPRPCSSPTCS